MRIMLSAFNVANDTTKMTYTWALLACFFSPLRLRLFWALVYSVYFKKYFCKLKF